MGQRTRYYAGWEPPLPDSSFRRRAISAIRWLAMVCGAALVVVALWVLWRATVCTVNVANHSNRRIDRIEVRLVSEGGQYDQAIDRNELSAIEPSESARCYVIADGSDAVLEATIYFADGSTDYALDGYVTGGMFFVSFDITIRHDGEVEIDQTSSLSY